MTMRTIVVILIALVTPVLAADVTYFPAEKVSAAFAKGAVPVNFTCSVGADAVENWSPIM